MHLFPDRSRRDDDVDTGLVGLLADLDIRGGMTFHAMPLARRLKADPGMKPLMPAISCSSPFSV